MKKVVFLQNLNKLSEALDFFDLKSYKNKSVPVKLHMGEKDNKYFPKPDDLKLVVDELLKINAEPFLFDTTVAYPGMRSKKDTYLEIANIHGFNKKNVGCIVKIDNSGKKVKVKGRDYEVADQIYNSDNIFVFSHVKGHIATGMGGAIKNLGMGGVTKETKRNMHNGSKPIYKKDNCTYCGICAERCPFDAINVSKEKWEISKSKCFGCGVCINNCKFGGLDYVDADIQYLLACSALACVKNKKVIYINDVNRIADSCDCDSFANKIICPDIGYLVSNDPVAIDKASIDLINEVEKDCFEKETHISPIKQIDFGVEIGLGSSDYSLIRL